MLNSDIQRHAYLAGVREASLLHNELNLMDKVRENHRAIDIFKVISKDLKIPLLFKNLEKLLGICLKDPSPGILINYKRPLSLQRFTAAHELGHYRMGHSSSLDQQIFQVVDEAETSRPVEEISADSFASAFLFPRWLYTIQGRNLRIKNREDVIDPNNVYQLSLRMGASYEATIYGLLSNNIITREDILSLKKVKPIDLKRNLLGKDNSIDSFADVWKMTESDHNKEFDLKEGDYIFLELPTRTPMGFTWAFKNSCFREKFDIIRDFHIAQPGDNYIGKGEKVATILKFKGNGTFKLALEEKRPWLKKGKSTKEFSTKLFINRPSQDGIPIFLRPQVVS